MKKYKSYANQYFTLKLCYILQNSYNDLLYILLNLKCIIFGLSYFYVDIFWYKAKCKQTSICPVEWISPWTSNSSLFCIIHWPWNVNIVFMILTTNQYMCIHKNKLKIYRSNVNIERTWHNGIYTCPIWTD